MFQTFLPLKITRRSKRKRAKWFKAFIWFKWLPFVSPSRAITWKQFLLHPRNRQTPFCRELFWVTFHKHPAIHQIPVMHWFLSTGFLWKIMKERSIWSDLKSCECFLTIQKGGLDVLEILVLLAEICSELKLLEWHWGLNMSPKIQFQGSWRWLHLLYPGISTSDGEDTLTASAAGLTWCFPTSQPWKSLTQWGVKMWQGKGCGSQLCENRRAMTQLQLLSCPGFQCWIYKGAAPLEFWISRWESAPDALRNNLAL